jgi:hypothetical protein
MCLDEHPTLVGRVLPLMRVDLEEHPGPPTIHGNDQVRQQVMKCLSAGDKLRAVVDNPYRLDQPPDPLSHVNRQCRILNQEAIKCLSWVRADRIASSNSRSAANLEVRSPSLQA